MVKPFLSAASVLLACGIAYSQNVVIDTRPAHEGKDLTMEEAIYKGAGYSRMPRLFLQADGSISDKPAARPQERYTLFQERGSPTFTYGGLAALIQLVGRIQTPIANAVSLISQAYGVVASAERLQEVFESGQFQGGLLPERPEQGELVSAAGHPDPHRRAPANQVSDERNAQRRNSRGGI